MDYIEKINLQTEEVKEVENLEKHIITNSEPISVDEYEGHTREFLAIGEDYNDGFNQLGETDGLGISCIVSKEVKEAREDVKGNSHKKLKARIDSEVNDLNEKIDNEVNDLNTSLKNIETHISDYYNVLNYGGIITLYFLFVNSYVLYYNNIVIYIFNIYYIFYLLYYYIFKYIK